jgi:predicted nucleic acid-binding protein
MPTSGADRIARLVLDTSAYSRFRAGHPAVLDLLAAADVVLVPVTVLGELEAGFELGTRARENRAVLASFLDEPSVAVLPVTPDVARHYGRMLARLKRAATPVPTNDIWIAAAAADCGGELLTFDEHFAKIEGLGCVVLKG